MKTTQKILLAVGAIIFTTQVQAVMYFARPYDPNAAHWLTRDPIGEQGGQNLYGFVNNNPVNNVDALGFYLAAVDGTDSEKWVGQLHHGSFVLNFYNDYIGSGGKDYENGPNLFGGGVSSTVNKVYNNIYDVLKKNPKEDINLVGHSRGGLIVILVAKKLHDNPPPCTKGEIKFMGLYDAVDRYLWADGSVIPDNVDFVAHARRDPGVHSRPWFGNTGTSGGKVYMQQFFWVTHSGAGGDPWGGDHPTINGVPTITQQQDIDDSKQVDEWMRNNARMTGLNGL